MRRSPRRRGGSGGRTVLILILFGVAAVLLVRFWPFAPGQEGSGRRRLSMAEARAVNAALPFAPGALLRAKPYVFRGTPAGREQAARCLAEAAIYEAGDDPRGQMAVMQVILNRVRLRGYPKTVCGVVYQGSTLSAGCQFSFTCDGSRQRRPERSGWAQARVRAKRALAGYVFRPVGRATHYHTDWVVPYWSNSLDKIAKVSTHIFYRRPD